MHWFLYQIYLGILCKLDIEKAYDHASWSFGLIILEKIGFPRNRRNWVLHFHCSFFYLN